MQTFGDVPVSVMVVAALFRNAPLLCCRHERKFPFVHCPSAVHECGGFSKACVRVASKQKPQKTRACAPVAKEVFVCVPLDRPKGTGRQPMNVVEEPGDQPEEAPPGGGQSWLVG